MESIKVLHYRYIAAFLTMRCNLSCSFCLNNMDKKTRRGFKELHGKEWVDSLNRIDSRPEVPITFCGGEPFLHKDFIRIINGLKPELNIDILTNLQWGSKGLQRFIEEVDPTRFRRDSPYASIRVSYHPEQMGNGEGIVRDVGRLQEEGFSVGIWSVLYPSSENLSAINQMQFRCRDKGIDFRVKEFTGKYKGEMYGDYSRYPGAISGKTESRLCKISELLIGPNGDVYPCHRGLYRQDFPTGNITDPNFKINTDYKLCDKFGECSPCDVKVKTNYKQKLGYTSVEIKNDK